MHETEIRIQTVQEEKDGIQFEVEPPVFLISTKAIWGNSVSSSN